MDDRVIKLVRDIDWAALKVRAAALESPCTVCPRRCGARRDRGETGFCGVASPMVSKRFVTYGEEPPLNPAYMLYFAGCNIRCAYCSNREFFSGGAPSAVPFGPVAIAGAVDTAFREGKIRVLQILGGEPACSLSGALEVASRLKSGVPVVWNSNLYFSEEAMELVGEFADFVVADLKFGCDSCAEELAGAPDYIETVEANLRRIPPRQLIVRHLPLGGHLECCARPVFEFLARELPGVPVGCHELLPDPAGICRGLDDAEHAMLAALFGEYGLRRISASYNPESGPASACDHFSGEILIRPDGSILVQDVPDAVRELMDAFTVEVLQ